MNSLYATYALYGLGAVVLGIALAKLRSRLQLSKASIARWPGIRACRGGWQR